MNLSWFRNGGFLILAMLLWPCAAPVSARESGSQAAPMRVAQADQAAIAEYRRKLVDYLRARQAFDAKADAYWNEIAEKRRSRNVKRRNNQAVVLDDYVLTQPPVYTGPPKPIDPAAPVPEKPPRKFIPVVADFLSAAKAHFNFVPQRPESEIDYKRGYAKAASAAGLTREQAVRVYGFEAGGNGSHDVQAGLERPRPGARAISTALGYNQLLIANTIDILSEHGERVLAALRAKALVLSGAPRQAFDRKIEAVRRMVALCRSVPYSWGEHVKLGETAKGWGVHALNLDIDVGPLLQTHKLLNSVLHARRKGLAAPLTAAELEMMNLTGDGNGFDMVTMPREMRDKVPTSNFFQRAGYERNPVAIRNDTVTKLLAATDAVMDREVKQKGAKELAGMF